MTHQQYSSLIIGYDFERFTVYFSWWTDQDKLIADEIETATLGM